jgi:hypothetical protein
VTALQAKRVFQPVTSYAPRQPMLPFEEDLPKPTEERLPASLQHTAQRIVTAIIEVIAGRRGIRQLEAFVSDTALHAIKRLIRAKLGHDLWLMSVHVQSPDSGVAEIAAHLRHGQTSKAAAIRLVHTATGWICTRFEAALVPHTITRAG